MFGDHYRRTMPALRIDRHGACFFDATATCSGCWHAERWIVSCWTHQKPGLCQRCIEDFTQGGKVSEVLQQALDIMQGWEVMSEASSPCKPMKHVQSRQQQRPAGSSMPSYYWVAVDLLDVAVSGCRTLPSSESCCLDIKCTAKCMASAHPSASSRSSVT